MSAHPKSTVFYKVIAILCFIVLLLVQYFLVFNTYKLKDQQYFLTEKDILNEQYRLSVRNDKVYPGGQKIIDSFIYKNMNALEYACKNTPAIFDKLRKAVCDSIFKKLRNNSNMDSLFNDLIEKNNLNRKFEYLLTVSEISITFTGNKYIPLYRANSVENSIPDQSPAGVVIAGKLSYPDRQNLVSDITVNNASDYSYLIKFSLYVDTPVRYVIIFKRMLPALLLSVFSILFITILYYFTYRNWLKQKKLAEMQSDFVNSVTHEFNTPLSTIIVANRNLQNENIYTSGKLILPLTDIIERQAQRLKTLFRHVLDITKMNESSLNKKEYVFIDLMNEILLDYRLTLNEKNVRLSLNNHINDEHILLDKFWFTTMLLNIFENAIKYNKSDIKEINITITKKDKQIELKIEDNGIGMSQKTLAHIFDKFYRSKNSMQEKTGGGLGLGLYYTKQCIQAHNWLVNVKSAENEGTSFIIHIL